MAEKKKQKQLEVDQTYQQLWQNAPINKRQDVVNYLNSLEEVKNLPLNTSLRKKLFNSAQQVVMEYLDPEFETKYKPLYLNDEGTELNWVNNLKAPEGSTTDVYTNVARRLFNRSYNGYRNIPLREQKSFYYNPNFEFNDYDYNSEGKQFDVVYQGMSDADRGKYVAKKLLGALQRFTSLENPETYQLYGIDMSELESLKKDQYLLKTLSENFDPTVDIARLRLVAARAHFDLDKFDRLFKLKTTEQSHVKSDEEKNTPKLFELPGYTLSPSMDGKYYTVSTSDNSIAFPGGIYFDDVKSPYYGKAYFTDETGKLYFGNLQDIESMMGTKQDGSKYLLAHTNTQYMDAYTRMQQMLQKRLGNVDGKFISDAHSYYNPYSMYGGLPDLTISEDKSFDYSPYLDEQGGYHYMDISDLIDGLDTYFMLLPKDYNPETKPWVDFTKNPIFKYSYTETEKGGRSGKRTRIANVPTFNFNTQETPSIYNTIINPEELANKNQFDQNISKYISSTIKELSDKSTQNQKALYLYNKLNQLNSEETNKPTTWYEKVATAITLYKLLSGKDSGVDQYSNVKGQSRKAAYELILKTFNDFETFKSQHGIASHKQGGILKFQNGSFEEWAKLFEQLHELTMQLIQSKPEELSNKRTNPYDSMSLDELEWRLGTPFDGTMTANDVTDLTGALVELSGYLTGFFSKNPWIDAASGIAAMTGATMLHGASKARGEEQNDFANAAHIALAGISGIGPVALANTGKLLRLLSKSPTFARVLKWTALTGAIGAQGVNLITDINNLVSIVDSEGIKGLRTRSALQSLKNVAMSLPMILGVLRGVSGFGYKGFNGKNGVTKIAPGEEITLLGRQGESPKSVLVTSDEFGQILKAGNKEAQQIKLNEILKQRDPNAALVELPSEISRKRLSAFRGYDGAKRVLLYDPEAFQKGWYYSRSRSAFTPSDYRKEFKFLRLQETEALKRPQQVQGNWSSYQPDVSTYDKSGGKLERLKKASKGMKVIKAQPGVKTPTIYSRLGFDNAAHSAYHNWVTGYLIPEGQEGYYDDQERGTILKNNRTANMDMHDYLWEYYLKDYLNSGLDLKDAKTAYKEWKTANPNGTPEQFKAYYDAIVDQITNYKKSNWGLTQGSIPSGQASDIDEDKNPLGAFASRHNTIYRSFNQGYDPTIGGKYGSANALRVANVRTGNEKSSIADLIDDLQEGEAQRKFYIDADGHIQFLSSNDTDKTLITEEEDKTKKDKGNFNIDLDLDDGSSRRSGGSGSFNIKGLKRSRHVPLNAIATGINYGLSLLGNSLIRKGVMDQKVALKTPKTHYAVTGTDYLTQQLLNKQAADLLWRALQQKDNLADLEQSRRIDAELRPYLEKISDKKAAIKSEATQRTMQEVAKVRDFNNDQRVDVGDYNRDKLVALHNLKRNAITENQIRNISDTQLLNKTAVELMSKEALDRREDENDLIEGIVQDKLANGMAALQAEYQTRILPENSNAYQSYKARMIAKMKAEGVSPSLLEDPSFINSYLKRSGNTFEESPEYAQYEEEVRKAYLEILRKIQMLLLAAQSARNKYKRTARGKWLWRDFMGENWGVDRLELLNSDLIAPRKTSALSATAPVIKAQRGTKLGDRYLKLLALNEKKRLHENKKSLEENKQHDKRVAGVLNELNQRDKMLILKLLK